MEITFPLSSDVCLKLMPAEQNLSGYPTSRLQKGLVLIVNGEELAEEGVGFGAPLLKLGLKTIYPGAVLLSNWREGLEITAVYRINLEEKLTRQNLSKVQSQLLYRVKDNLAGAYRRFPRLRRGLTALSNGLRGGFGWQTTYEYSDHDYAVKVHYAVDQHTGLISMDIDASALPHSGVTEVVIMNEQGAHHFDAYMDTNGARLHGEAIGSWEEVTAERACFNSSRHRLEFCLPQVEAARLFRGRELVGSRLAWAGFGYSFAPISQRIAYPLQIERLP